MHPPPIPSRVAELRLPNDLPTRDLERLAATTPTHLPAPASAPASFGLPPAHKFGNGEASPADVRVFGPAHNVAPLLMRGVVVSPSPGGGSGLVLPNLSLPLSSPANSSLPLPSVSQPRSAGTDTLNPGMASTLVSPMSISHPTATLPPPRSAPLSAVPSLARSVVGAPGRTTTSTTAGRVAMAVSTTAPPSPANPVGGTSAGSTPQLSQTEIKKAQNRKSAKRFREAQKQRWKNMADELLLHKKTISDLRARLATQDAAVRKANSIFEGAAGMQGSKSDKRSAMSIHDLVDGGMPMTSPMTPPGMSAAMMADVETEATLYAQILSNTSQKGAKVPGGSSVQEPYARDLGVLQLSYVVVKASSRVVGIRRGNATTFGTFAVDGLGNEDATEFRKALTCGKPVAVGFARHGVRINAVMHPVENSDRVVVAEFSPLQ